MKVVIADLDGTICDIGHRLHKIRPPKYPHGAGEQLEPKPDWDGFYELCDFDEPKMPIIRVLQALSQHYPVVIISGRSEIVLVKTQEWLAKHVVPYQHLVMRLKGDFRPDHELKLDALKLLNLAPADILCVIEDRERVVKMWRDLGVTCLQCQDGDY